MRLVFSSVLEERSGVVKSAAILSHLCETVTLSIAYAFLLSTLRR